MKQWHASILCMLILPWSKGGAESLTLFDDAPENGYRLQTWGFSHEIRSGGTQTSGYSIALNSNWAASPWAGLKFSGGKELTVTQSWIERGFIHLKLNASVTRYGSPNGTLDLQIRPDVQELSYQRINPIHIGRGRGLDEDPESWQEVMIPLSYWTDLKVASIIRGLQIQVVGSTDKAFGIDEVRFIRYDTLPQWYQDLRNQSVFQPDVEWPEFASIPRHLRADSKSPALQAGAFVDTEGKRTFLIHPYTREDASIDLWGNRSGVPKPPDYGLFDDSRHGWIYNQLLTHESLIRLGFNSLSVTVPPENWYAWLGYRQAGSGESLNLPQLIQRTQLPFHVDMVHWPWALGKPVVDGFVPADSLTEGMHHWVDYRIIGEGRKRWLELWELYAKRYAEAQATVLTFELMNEPSYLPTSSDHREEFRAWLVERYGDLQTLNRTWRTNFSTWDEAATYRYKDTPLSPEVIPQCLDYDAYLAGRFTTLFAEGAAVVRKHLPETLIGIQTMSNFLKSPRESVWKHLLVPHETVVIAPTGGGSWTSGGGATAATPALAAPIASAPLSNDLLLALAGNKMIIDNERYLTSQTRTGVFNELWTPVICGMDGLSVFSWSKRGWVWQEGKAAVEIDADKYPYSSLIPLARRTDALRGIYDFSASVRSMAADILPKPWGPAPRIALIYCWDDARRRNHEPKPIAKVDAYYAALKYSHWNFRWIPSDQVLANGSLEGIDVVIVGGLRAIHPAVIPRLSQFVEQGGTLIVGEEPFNQDLYGNPIDTWGLSNGWSVSAPEGVPGTIQWTSFAREPAELPGKVVAQLPVRFLREDLLGCHTLARGEGGAAVITGRPYGKGQLYVQGADVLGYPLAKLIWAILADAALQAGHSGIPSQWRLAELTEPQNGQLATNLLLSRRSYEQKQRHVFLIQNRDGYARSVRLRVALEPGPWSIEKPLQNTPSEASVVEASELASVGIPLAFEANGVSVIIFRKLP